MRGLLRALLPAVLIAAVLGAGGALAGPRFGVPPADGAQMALGTVGFVLVLYGSFPRSRAGYMEYLVKGGLVQADRLRHQDRLWAREQTEWNLRGRAPLIVGLVYWVSAALLYTRFG